VEAQGLSELADDHDDAPEGSRFTGARTNAKDDGPDVRVDVISNPMESCVGRVFTAPGPN